jgi:hypothetical protein
MSTTSWLNISLSIEQIFATLLPDMPRFRFGLPEDEGERRSLVHETNGALFFNLVQGDIDRWQDTYCTLWLCQRQEGVGNRIYTPLKNYKGLWLQEQVANVQAALNEGGAAYCHLFPLYDYQRMIPAPLYSQFLTNGDTTPIEPYLLTPNVIPNTGFVVRAGHSNPAFIFDRDPMVVEWTVVFQHWSYDVWCGQKG